MGTADFLPLIESINALIGDPVEEHTPPSPLAPAVADDPQHCRHTVALVDDSPAERGLLRIALESCGQFSLAGEAADGPSAIELAAKTHPDVLFLDMSMTGMNGLEALGPIQAVSPKTRVVFLSGFLSGALSEAISKAGAFAQFDKSVPRDALVAQLLELLDDRAAEAPALNSVA